MASRENAADFFLRTFRPFLGGNVRDIGKRTCYEEAQVLKQARPNRRPASFTPATACFRRIAAAFDRRLLPEADPYKSSGAQKFHWSPNPPASRDY